MQFFTPHPNQSGGLFRLISSQILKRFRFVQIAQFFNKKLSWQNVLSLILFSLLNQNVSFAQCATCGEQVGGKGKFSAWSKVKFYTKKIDAPNYNLDQLSAYASGGTYYSATYDAIGINGPANNEPRFQQINYVAEVQRSEKLLVDFGACQTYTGAVVNLVRLFGPDGTKIIDQIEAGCWKAFDANFVQVGAGTFVGTQTYNGDNNGDFQFSIKTALPYRYLEFTAKPYIPLQKAVYADDSDYFLKSIQPTCTKIVTCDDILGGTNEFGGWQQAGISTKSADSQFYKYVGSEVFVNDQEGYEGSNGLGVPDDTDGQINFNTTSNASEALRIDLGSKTKYAQFTVSQLFNGEQGFWKAYKFDGCELVEVASGNFKGEEVSDGIVKAAGRTGGKTVTATSTDDFQVVEFTAGPTQSTKTATGSGYVLNQFVACPTCSGAFELIEYKPGKTKKGQKLSSIVSNPNNAIGTPQNNDYSEVINYVSLGFKGSITLKFAQPFANGVGNDIQIFETSSEKDCKKNPEKAEVFASQNGTDFIYLGKICQDGTVDLGVLAWAQYVRIIDASEVCKYDNDEDDEDEGEDDGESASTWSDSDGYDLDGITCLNGKAENPVPSTLIACSAQSVKNYKKGLTKNGSNINSARTNPSEALGLPNSSDQYLNCVSLGFGDGRQKGVKATKGYIDLGFDFVIFDKPNTKEILIVEKSLGNSKFKDHPEQAKVYVSKDAINWVYLGKTNAANPEKDCNLTLDTEFDFAGKINWARYVKIVDITDPNARTRRSSDCKINNNQYAFNNAADAFDVDAVVCSASYSKSKSVASNTATQTTVNHQESFGTPKLYPNPAQDYLFLDFSEVEDFVSPEEGQLHLKVYNVFGQLMHQEVGEISGDFNLEMSITKLPKGMYVVKFENSGMQKSIKFVK